WVPHYAAGAVSAGSRARPAPLECADDARGTERRFRLPHPRLPSPAAAAKGGGRATGGVVRGGQQAPAAPEGKAGYPGLRGRARPSPARPRRASAPGERTGALCGVATMLRRTRKEKPDSGAFVGDAPGKTFRDALYPDCKATRPPMPDELRAQVQPMCEIVHA